jgi:hypothetical protein
MRLQRRNGSALDSIIKEALAVEHELRTLNTLDAQKLAPMPYVRAAIAVARTTTERLAKLREELEGNKPGMDAARWAYRMMITAIRTPNFPAPPSELRRLNFLLTADALAELAALGFSSFELFAVCAQVAAEKYPQDFGTCEDTQAHEKRVLELTLHRDELFARIANEYSADDIVIEDPDGEGRARVTFRISDGKVTVGPKQSAGERLVNWLLSQASVEKRT